MKSDDFGLPVAAGFFQNATDMGPHRIVRSVAVTRHVVRFPAD
jgi:hypothetical protein